MVFCAFLVCICPSLFPCYRRLSSADNLRKQFVPRSGGLIWLQTVCNSNGILEIILKTNDFEKKSEIDKKKAYKINQHGTVNMLIEPPVAWAAFHSKAVVLMLLIYCLIYFPLFVGVLSVFVLLCITLSPF